MNGTSTFKEKDVKQLTSESSQLQKGNVWKERDSLSCKSWNQIAEFLLFFSVYHGNFFFYFILLLCCRIGWLWVVYISSTPVFCVFHLHTFMCMQDEGVNLHKFYGMVLFCIILIMYCFFNDSVWCRNWNIWCKTEEFYHFIFSRHCCPNYSTQTAQDWTKWWIWGGEVLILGALCIKYDHKRQNWQSVHKKRGFY